MTDMLQFGPLAEQVRFQKALDPISEQGVLMSFDPGHTTGWSVFVQYELAETGEIDTSDIPLAVVGVNNLIEEYNPHVIVLEDYRVYRWRQKHHVGSELLTTRVIGCIETLSTQYSIPVFKQPAHIAKGFCNDKKLKEWGFWQKGQKHARDAIRHACYFLIFGGIKKSDAGKYKHQTVG